MVVDDHPMWRDTIRDVLNRSGTARVVAETSDGRLSGSSGASGGAGSAGTLTFNRVTVTDPQGLSDVATATALGLPLGDHVVVQVHLPVGVVLG